MIWMWVGFLCFVLVLLALDLGVFHRKAHVVSLREALGWSAVWIALSLLFNVFIYFAYEHHWQGLGLHESRMHPEGLDGHRAAVLFFTGYVVEKSLSVDNIFVIALVFAFFKIPDKYQHRVLFWGILGALVMRGLMIGIGAALIAKFHWILYIFGVFLIWTAYKMLFTDSDPDPEKSALVKYARKLFPLTPVLHGQQFLVKTPAAEATSGAVGGDASPPGELCDVGNAKGATTVHPPETTEPDSPLLKTQWMLTPLALALIVVEGTDLIFAVDSIPAIFAITTDPFLVFTSNVCAILGLRALYFALAGILHKFRYLKVSLAVVLGLVGIKMLAADWLKKFAWFDDNLSFLTLGLIALILAAGIMASLMIPAREEKPVIPPA